MDKKIIGSGSKDSVFHLMYRDCGADVVVDRMSGLAKLCARWLCERHCPPPFISVSLRSGISSLSSSLSPLLSLLFLSSPCLSASLFLFIPWLSPHLLSPIRPSPRAPSL